MEDEERRGTTTMEDDEREGWLFRFPDEVIERIFSKLSLEELQRMAVLSIKWGNLVSRLAPNLRNPQHVPFLTIFRTGIIFQRFRERVSLRVSDDSLCFASNTTDSEEEVFKLLLNILFYRDERWVIKTPFLSRKPFPFGWMTRSLEFFDVKLPSEVLLPYLIQLTIRRPSFSKPESFSINAPRLKRLVVLDSGFDNFSDFKLNAGLVESIRMEGFLFNNYVFSERMTMLNNVSLKLMSLPLADPSKKHCKPNHSRAMFQLLEGLSGARCILLCLSNLQIRNDWLAATAGFHFPNLEQLNVESVTGAEVEIGLITNIVRNAPRLKALAVRMLATANSAMLDEEVLRVCAPKEAVIRIR